MHENGTLIVSDAHLGAAPPECEARFLRLLEQAPGRTRDLVINGDLFDFWFEYRTVLLRRHFGTLRTLRSIVDAGVRVRLVAGNHDAWGAEFLRDELGLELLHGPVETTLGGRRAVLAHGDGIGSGDLGYRAVRRVIRSRAARLGFRWIHPDLSAHLVRLVSRTEARHGGSAAIDSSLRRARRLEEWATERLAGDPALDVVALAHCHVPLLREVAPGRCYVNSGDWVRSCSWAEIDPERVRLVRWDGHAGEILHEIESPARPGGRQGPAGME